MRQVGTTIDGQPFRSAFLAPGVGARKLPVKAALRRTLGKQVGECVTVHLQERLPGSA